MSLFSLGFELDERIEERLQNLKRSTESPAAALPGLKLLDAGWKADRFFEWVSGHGQVETTPSPVGRRLKGTPPATLDQQVRRLIAGLMPAAENYPLPHFRKAP